ncbi:MAG TPA: nitric oxide synthase oxygenase, partial [Acidimicrobiales bacterium]|nr:nitric oxide synthase oxygenase [Acidimicrobiales bacterium]
MRQADDQSIDDLAFEDETLRHSELGDLALLDFTGRAGSGQTVVDAPVHGPSNSVFRSNRALLHDTLRAKIRPDHVAAEWAMMYHWLRHDEELAAVCGFARADLTQSAEAARTAQLRREIGHDGRTFTVLQPEMHFWVRFSWIGADRCSGRQHALQHAVIRHRPDVTSAADMLREAVEHADIAMSAPLPPQTVITVLGPPTAPGELGQMFATEQLLRPAGYLRNDGAFVGDRGYVDLTDWVRNLDLSLIQ